MALQVISTLVEVGDLVWLHSLVVPWCKCKKFHCPWTGLFKIIKLYSRDNVLWPSKTVFLGLTWTLNSKCLPFTASPLTTSQPPVLVTFCWFQLLLTSCSRKKIVIMDWCGIAISHWYTDEGGSMNVTKVSLALLTLCVIKGRVGKARICCFCHCYNYCRTICKKALLSSNFTASACRILSPLYQMILTLDTEAAVYPLPDRGLRRRGVPTHKDPYWNLILQAKKGAPFWINHYILLWQKRSQSYKRWRPFWFLSRVEGFFFLFVGNDNYEYKVRVPLWTTVKWRRPALLSVPGAPYPNVSRQTVFTTVRQMWDIHIGYALPVF